MADSEEDEEHKSFWERWRGTVVRVLVVLIVIGGIVFAIVETARSKEVSMALGVFAMWLRDQKAWGAVVLSLMYAVFTVLFLPGSLLTLAAGWAFSQAYGIGVGFAIASASVVVGASLGAVGSFLLARYAFRGYAESLAEKYTAAKTVTAAVRGGGLWAIVLLRLSPLIPFNALNYVLGVLPVSLFDYSLALIAMIPGTAAYTYGGAVLGAVTSPSALHPNSISKAWPPWLRITVLVVGIVTALAATIILGYFARKELLRLARENQDEENQEQNQQSQRLLQTIN